MNVIGQDSPSPPPKGAKSRRRMPGPYIKHRSMLTKTPTLKAWKPRTVSYTLSSSCYNSPVQPWRSREPETRQEPTMQEGNS